LEGLMAENAVSAPPRGVVVVGASAGGVEALIDLVGRLPADLEAPVLVVLHITATGTSALPQILSRAGPLPAVHAEAGAQLEAGHIYIAPPDRHLLIRDGAVDVVRGPRENLLRPAIDPLFRSAAVAYGPRVVAVVLSGTRDDGAAGAAAVSRRGGGVVVQDPEEAVFPEMPLNAIARDHPDYVLPLPEMTATLIQLVRSFRSGGTPVTMGAEMNQDVQGDVDLEARYAALERHAVERDQAPGELTPFSCPECGGALWETRDADLPRYRCRVGHAYATDAMVEDQSNAVDKALWTALRALLERASLSERIAQRVRGGNGSNATAERFDRLAEEAHAQAAVIRDVLLRRDASSA
jgi:two-component system chemotaxis response regulator CheB